MTRAISYDMAGKYPGPISVIKLHTRLAMYGVWEVDHCFYDMMKRKNELIKGIKK